MEPINDPAMVSGAVAWTQDGPAHPPLKGVLPNAYARFGFLHATRLRPSGGLPWKTRAIAAGRAGSTRPSSFSTRRPGPDTAPHHRRFRMSRGSGYPP